MYETARSRILTFGVFLLGCAATLPAAAAEVRILQTNSRGDNIHIIDPATHSIVGEITGVPVNHGAAAAPDASRFYFSSEATRTLDVVDGSTLEKIKSIPLSARPHNISITPDGRYVYVAIISEPGAVDVIDTGTLEVVKSIPNEGGVHNVFVTPDGRYVLAGSISGEHMTVIDVATNEPVWKLFDQGVRPIAMETHPDRSVRRLFVQLSDFHGFAIVDFDARAEVGRVTLPDVPEAQRNPGPYNRAPAHGIGVAPDGRTLWVCSRMNGHVYAYSLPDLEYLGGVQTGHDPDWLTFTPDSRFVYVANGGANSVSVVDVAALEEVERIPVGDAPKRNITVTVP